MERFLRKVDKLIDRGVELRHSRITELNEGMYVHKEDDRVVTLHLSSDADTIPPLAMAAKTREALHKFATILQSDTSFKEVETIAAISWIVRDYPALIKKLGFSIDADNESSVARDLTKRYSTKQHRLVAPHIKRYELPKVALMDREEFLRRYGS